jgi:tetratricopeptide (TPR) repeat protein
MSGALPSPQSPSGEPAVEASSDGGKQQEPRLIPPSPVDGNRGAWERREWIVAGVLAAGAVLAFAQVLGCDFVSYDDGMYVTANPNVQGGLSVRGLRWAWSAREGFWHPLTWMSLQLDAGLFGLNPAAFHLTNLLWHVANVVLLFAVLRRLTGQTWPSALAAALFALHPLHVESVAWISERKGLLSTFFGLLALWFYAGYAASTATSTSPGRYLPIAVCLALSLLAKPVLVTLPLLLLLLDYWPLGRFQQKMPTAPRGREPACRQAAAPGAAALRLVLEKVPLLALAIGFGVVAVVAEQQVKALPSLERVSLAARLAHVPLAYAGYLARTFWPTHLAVFYQHPGNTVPLGETLGATALLLGITVAVLLRPLRKPYLVVGWFWFLVTLAPVSGLVQVGLQGMADRYTYVPLIGLFIALAWGLCDLLRRWEHARGWVIGLTSAILAACLALTWRQVGTWKDSQTLWTHAVAVTPSCDVGHANLALLAWARGERSEAIKELRQAHQERPDYASYSYELGRWLLEVGEVEEGLDFSAKSLRIKGSNATAAEYLDLGNLCLNYHQARRARAQLQEAIDRKPDLAEAFNGLGTSWSLEGRPDKAEPCYARAVELAPSSVLARNNLGLALLEQGRLKEAMAALDQAVQLKANYADAWNNLGTARALAEKWPEAATAYSWAVALDPDTATYHCNLAHALHEQGQKEKSHEEYKEGLRLDPKWVERASQQAWQLATDPEDRRRQGARARQLAQQSCEAAGERPELLDVLAAADAELGSYEEAVKTARQALDLAEKSGQRQLADQVRERLRFYSRREPYRRGP